MASEKKKTTKKKDIKIKDLPATGAAKDVKGGWGTSGFGGKLDPYGKGSNGGCGD